MDAGMGRVTGEAVSPGGIFQGRRLRAKLRKAFEIWN